LAYVNKRAISAGALISLSCKKIGMSPGSSMGATTVVSGEGEKASEKAQSYMRAEMGATAELNG
ncbi:MAG: nodulation protein NfeD, partial [Calditrichia bacterium]